ncbi:uncharacterized protein LOC115481563 [Microcaecilia unicolor]|uniref:Uncharacterized protein LOC115481563 n=1 Tax=Microcaecilia unicolor TaxID=1415580 RepID=A0A6P7ZFM7_9AMPH|nr:uncharacterized protein LOC115481563 [Microcaecilia unicolor]
MEELHFCLFQRGLSSLFAVFISVSCLLMASHRTARSWTDLQESLNRVHQQLGLIPGAGRNSLIMNNPHLSTHSAEEMRWRTHSSPFLPSLADAPQVQREKKLVVHPVCGKDGRKETWRKCGFVGHENNIRELPNQPMLHKSQKSYPLKFHHKRQMKNSLLDLQAPIYSLSLEQFSMSLLEDLLHEVLRQLSVNVLRNAMQELVDDHLARAAMYDITDEIVSEAVQSLLPVAIQETQWELEWEETLDAVISDVIEEEVMVVLDSALSEHNAELLKLRQKQVSASAGKYLIDLFLLEHLIKMHGPALPWKDETSRCLDSWMLNILLRQYFHMHEQQRATVENPLLEDFHQRAFREVALDVILTELSKSLEEDMEDLLENEIQMEIGEVPAD